MYILQNQTICIIFKESNNMHIFLQYQKICKFYRIRRIFYRIRQYVYFTESDNMYILQNQTICIFYRIRQYVYFTESDNIYFTESDNIKGRKFGGFGGFAENRQI